MATRIRFTVFNIVCYADILDNWEIEAIIEDRVLSKLKTYKQATDYGRVYTTIDKLYYIRSGNRLFLPVTCYRSIIKLLEAEGIKNDEIEVKVIQDTNIYPTITTTWNTSYIPRDYQMEYHDIIVNNINRKIFLIDLQTGMGKTLIMCKTIATLGYRVAMVLLAKYIGKWIEDFKNYLDIDESEIYVIKGESKYRKLLELSKEELAKYKVFLLSTTTIGKIIQDVEDGNYKYKIPFTKLLRHLEVPLLANDETHQHFYVVSRCMLLLNPKWFIGSTATLVSSNSNQNGVYRIYVPHAYRISNLVTSQNHVNVVSVGYRMERHVRDSNKFGYNHNILESEILGDYKLEDSYFEMITEYLVDYYMLKKQDGDKAAIYFSSLVMIDRYFKYLSKEYEDRYTIGKYIGGDEYSKLFQFDIIITNMPMAGTAVDIPKLIVCIQTVCAFSIQANLQNFGRLRYLHGKETTYIYFYCTMSEKHRIMHIKRHKLLKKRCKKWTELKYNKILKMMGEREWE